MYQFLDDAAWQAEQRCPRKQSGLERNHRTIVVVVVVVEVEAEGADRKTSPISVVIISPIELP